MSAGAGGVSASSSPSEGQIVLKFLGGTLICRLIVWKQILDFFGKTGGEVFCLIERRGNLVRVVPVMSSAAENVSPVVCFEETLCTLVASHARPAPEVLLLRACAAVNRDEKEARQSNY